MTHLWWRDANLRHASDKKLLQLFRCTDEDLRTEITLTGRTRTTHSRLYEWRVQQLIQEDVRGLNKKRWIVRLGFDDVGLGAVVVAEELDAGRDYHVTLGAIASRIRGRFHGELGDEMLDDVFNAVEQRCVEGGYSGEARLTGLIHKDNSASKRMCERKGFEFEGISTEDADHEDWARTLPIPDIPLFDPSDDS